MDFYEILGVERDASIETIRQAYRQKAKVAHPDAGGDAERFKELERAARTLTDPERRKKYDASSMVSDDVDNTDALALRRIGNVIETILMSDPAPDRRDFIASVRETLRDLIDDQLREATIASMEIAKRKKLMAGLRTTDSYDPVRSLIQVRVGELETIAEAMDVQIRVLRRAVEMLKTYSFTPSGGSAAASRGGYTLSSWRDAR